MRAAALSVRVMGSLLSGGVGGRSRECPESDVKVGGGGHVGGWGGRAAAVGWGHSGSRGAYSAQGMGPDYHCVASKPGHPWGRAKLLAPCWVPDFRRFGGG